MVTVCRSPDAIEFDRLAEIVRINEWFLKGRDTHRAFVYKNGFEGWAHCCNEQARASAHTAIDWAMARMDQLTQ
jgi:hypothetical protein